MIEIKIYETDQGIRPFEKWLSRIDRNARNRILIALEKLENGNTSQLKSVGGGVWELRIFFGPGYRIYLGRNGDTVVILLNGGTKKRQSEAISKAKTFWQQFLAERNG